jgi:hypothetical protein
MKGQVSAELLIIVGFILLMITPLLFIAYTKMGESNEKLALAQAEMYGARLASLVDTVGGVGGNASMITEINVPPYVKNISAEGKEVVFALETSAGMNELVKVTRFNMTSIDFGRLEKPGTYYIEIRAEEGTVYLTVQ